MSKTMPSVDQVAKCDQKGEKGSKIGAKNTQNRIMNDKHTQVNGAGAIAEDQPKQNGHTVQDGTASKSMNAHLAKTDVICLDRSPVKPVVLDATIKTEDNKMKDSKQVENGTGAEKQNGSAGTSDKKHDSKSDKLDVGKDDKKLRKQPKSFNLLEGQICKQCKPSKKGKLARQRATSDMSYEKQHHRMVHTNSDPTGLPDRDNVFEGGVERFKCEKDAETKMKKVDEVSEKKDKDIDQLAESLGSSLQIKSDSESGDAAAKEKSDKKVSDLADDLNRISVKDEASSSSKVGAEKKDTVVIVKQEPIDSSEDATSTKKPNVVVLPGKDSSAGKFSNRVSKEDKNKMLSRGVNQVYPNQAPASGNYIQYQQRSYPTSSGQSVSIPSFQSAFVNNNIVGQPYDQFIQQRVQLQERIQHVNPPCYRTSAEQQIVLPSSTTASKPIVVPPPSSYQMSGQQYNHQQQLQMQVTQLHQNKFVMPLQEPQHMMSQLPTSGRQPQESTWPNDMASLPPHAMEDNNPIMSPPSVSSDTSSVGYPVSPRYSNHGSPQVQGYYPPQSPYQTVPTRSPEQPPINSPQAPSPSPGPASPYSQHTITAGNNFGTVMVTDETPTAKRQCVEDPMKADRINEIKDFLQQGSPGSTVSSHEGDQDPSVSPTYQPYSPGTSSISSGPPTPSPAHLTQYQPEPQPSPTPGMSPAAAAQPIYSYGIPLQAVNAIPQGYQGGYQTQLSPHQTFGQAEAVVPTQTANQQGYDELEDFRQKVGQLSNAQLMEQDEDQDTILHVAICHEQKLLIQALMERVAKIPKMINMKNKLSQTPLYLAAATNQPDFVTYLIMNGADPTIPADRAGNTPLHHAAEQGYVQVIEAIFSGYGGRLGRIPEGFADAKNFEGKSPLHIAVESHGTPGIDHTGKYEKIDSLQTIKMLMKYGASAVCQDDKSGKTSLHYAVEMHKGDMTRLLLDLCDSAGELVNCQMYNGNTALHLIVGRREVQMEEILRVVSLLMRFGANVSIENAEKDTPMRLVQNGHAAIKKHLAGQSH